MDREISSEVRRRKVLRQVVVALIALVAIAFFFAATVQWLRPSIRRRDIQTARVERGSVDATLQASGTVMPAVEQAISSPIEARVLRIVRRAGERVRAGDELVALDTSATRLEAGRLNAQVQQKQSELAQLRLQSENALASLRATLEQKQLDADILEFKAQQSRKLHEEGLAAAQDDMAAATAAKKSRIELVQLRDQLARQQRIDQAQIAAASAALQSLVNDRDESQRQVQLAMMNADRDGVLTSIVDDAGAMIRRGDVVARIADLSSFRVDATISDAHAAEIAPGMPVRVKVDESTTVTGSISTIEPRIDGGVVKFHVRLDDSSNPRLRNNVRVDVFVVTGHRQDVLRLRRGVLGAGERENVYVIRDGEAARVPVRWGLAGEQFIQPLDGLREGDEVVISNMSDYEGVGRVRVR